jgi:hypothetical protein
MSVNIVYDVTIVVACMRFVDIIALHCTVRDVLKPLSMP